MKILPTISIVTPSFNQAEYLERTLCSVLNQDYPNIEYIVMDGGSTDGSVEIIKKYSDRLAYWQSQPDGGQTAAICAGFEHASGELFMYLNSDDMLFPGAVSAYVKAWQQGARWGLGNLHIIDQNDDVIAKRPIYPFSLGDLWHNRYIIPQEATFYSRELYEQCGGFDPSYHYAMDYHMWLRMASIAKPVRVHQYTAAFRVTPEQKSANAAHYTEDVIRALRELKEWRKEKGMPECPPRPLLSGKIFFAAKSLHYLFVGGWKSFWKMYRFRKGNACAIDRQRVLNEGL